MVKLFVVNSLKARLVTQEGVLFTLFGKSTALTIAKLSFLRANVLLIIGWFSMDSQLE
jgi:hypothetical protein